MDYDKTAMPANYDAGRGYSPEVMARWLGLFSAHAAPDQVADILDLGCGTGRFSATLAAHFDARVIGVDPSEKMLAQAAEKDFGAAVTFRQGSGEALPLEDASVDLVFLSMVFHHLPDPAATARECRRVLRPGGKVMLRNGTTDQIASYPFHGFFPGVEAVLRDSLVSCAEIARAFDTAGFGLAHHEAVAHLMAPSWAAYAQKAALRADSILARLPDAAFHQGMAALRAFAATADPAEGVSQNVDFFVFNRTMA